MNTIHQIMISLHIIFALYIIYVVIGVLKVPKLSTFISSDKNFHYPLISIIVPACNEEDTIKEGIQSLLNLEYPHLEFIIVNDRSSDNTGKIIQEISLNDKRVKYIEIESLPDGWIGKVHAVWQGSKKANGDWLLFTDADVLYHPQTLHFVMNYLKTKQYDHLTVAPRMITNSIWLRGIILMLKLNLFIFLRPQFMHKKSSTAGMGIGAFNIIKRDVYEKIGTHEAIRLCVDDPDKKIAMVLMTALVNNGYFTDLNTAFHALLKAIQVSLKYGNTKSSAFAYVGYAIMLSWVFEKYKTGYKLGEIGLEISKQFEDSMFDSSFDHEAFIEKIMMPTNVYMYYIVNLQFQYLLGNYKRALEWAELANPLDQYA